MIVPPEDKNYDEDGKHGPVNQLLQALLRRSKRALRAFATASEPSLLLVISIFEMSPLRRSIHVLQFQPKISVKLISWRVYPSVCMWYVWIHLCIYVYMYVCIYMGTYGGTCVSSILLFSGVRQQAGYLSQEIHLSGGPGFVPRVCTRITSMSWLTPAYVRDLVGASISQRLLPILLCSGQTSPLRIK